jgi:hypothetical protein
MPLEQSLVALKLKSNDCPEFYNEFDHSILITYMNAGLPQAVAMPEHNGFRAVNPERTTLFISVPEWPEAFLGMSLLLHEKHML